MPNRPRPVLLALSMGALLAAFASCAAPTLPLPPPSTEVGPPNELGIVEVTGDGAEPQSIVVCENEQDQESVGIDRADDAGSFLVTLQASPRDMIACYYIVGFDRSEPKETPVPE